MLLLLFTAKSCLSLCVLMNCSLPGSFLCPWDFLSKKTGVGCHFLLQGVFPTQGSNLHLLHWQPPGNLKDLLKVVLMRNVTAKACVDSRYSLMSRDPSAFHDKGNKNEEDHEAFLYTAKSSTYEPSSCKLSKMQIYVHTSKISDMWTNRTYECTLRAELLHMYET